MTYIHNLFDADGHIWLIRKSLIFVLSRAISPVIFIGSIKDGKNYDGLFYIAQVVKIVCQQLGLGQETTCAGIRRELFHNKPLEKR
jgi:hypothetical protein